MDPHSWLDSWTEWQTPSPSSTSKPPSSSSSYTTNTPLPASGHSSSPSSAPSTYSPPLTLDPYSPTDLSYLSPPLSLCYSPNGSDSSNFPSPLDTQPPPLTPIQALSFPDFEFDFPTLQSAQSHLQPEVPMSPPPWPPSPSVAEGSYAPPGCDNMLGLDWSYYNYLPPSQAVPNSMVHSPAQCLAGTYIDKAGKVNTASDSSNGGMVDTVYSSPDALACPPHRTQRVTRARKLTSSTTRSARRTLPSSSSPLLSTTSFSSSSIKTYKPRRALGTGTPNFTSLTPCDTSYLCTTCHSTYPLTRSSDFTRHVLTHYPEYRGGALLCCGVPVDSDQCLAMIAKGMIPPDAPVRRYYGRWMVGGCGLLCARTDVLRKHLGNGRRGCVGDLTGDWHPPKLPKM